MLMRKRFVGVSACSNGKTSAASAYPWQHQTHVLPHAIAALHTSTQHPNATELAVAVSVL